MKMDNGLHQLVYDFFETRIQYGFYRYGDKLPSIQKIGIIFHLAPATVRSALALLEKNGYIRVDARKVSKVIYQVDTQKYREDAARYFVPRKEGIIDLFESGNLLLEPLWEAGLERWGDEEWEKLRCGISELIPGAVTMPVEFYILVLGALDNRLIMNFYWELIRYIRFPYLRNLDEQRTAYPELREQPKEKIVSFLKQEFEKSYGVVVNELFEFIDQEQKNFFPEGVTQVPFQWQIYRQRPQLRYTLVSSVISEIMGGHYPEGSYLPSLPQMAKRYGVSLNTVRRALVILESMGITRSYHGKGTLVCMEPSEEGFSAPEVKEGVRLFQESLQFLTLTIRQVSLYTLEHVPESKNILREKLTALQKNKKSYLCFEEYLSFLESSCPLNIVRECYGRVREQLPWGYPVVVLRIKKGSLNEEYMQILQKMEQSLERDQVEEFSEIWKRLIEEEEKRFIEWMESLA